MNLGGLSGHLGAMRLRNTCSHYKQRVIELPVSIFILSVIMRFVVPPRNRAQNGAGPLGKLPSLLIQGVCYPESFLFEYVFFSARYLKEADSEPGFSWPGTSNVVLAEPGFSQPGTARMVLSKPGFSQPGTTKAVFFEPGFLWPGIPPVCVFLVICKYFFI